MSKLLQIRQGLYAGETVKAGEIGHKGYSRYIWANCLECGKGRWGRIKAGGIPEFKLCASCIRKGERSWNWGLKGELCHNWGKRHEKAANWKGGIRKRPGGYLDIKLEPDDFFYSMADHQGYVREHRLVVAKALGRCLHTWEEVHHKGTKYPRGSREDKGDNRRENLEIMTKGCHTLEHRKGYSNGYLKGLQDGRLKQIQELKEEIEELRRK